MTVDHFTLITCSRWVAAACQPTLQPHSGDRQFGICAENSPTSNDDVIAGISCGFCFQTTSTYYWPYYNPAPKKGDESNGFGLIIHVFGDVCAAIRNEISIIHHGCLARALNLQMAQTNE